LTFRIISIIGWICLALDTAFVVALFVVRDAGSDAAGRGIGRGWALVLLPVLLSVGGLLCWATRSGSKIGLVVSTLLVALPFLMLTQGRITQMSENVRARAQQAEHGQFVDAHLNRVVAAIDAGDTSALQQLLASNTANGVVLNHTERDRAGETLLGFAVTRALAYDASPERIAALRILLKLGVPYAADAQAVGRDWSYEALTSGSEHSTEIANIALDAGADSNQQDRYDRYPIIMSYQLNVPKLQLLVQHGANVHARNERGETTLYNMVRFKKYAEALFFLEHGVDPETAASDGTTMQEELDKGVREYRSQRRPMEPGYDAFIAALAVRRQAAGARN